MSVIHKNTNGPSSISSGHIIIQCITDSSSTQCVIGQTYGKVMFVYRSTI